MTIPYLHISVIHTKQEKSAADKRKSASTLKNVLKSWQPGAPLEPSTQPAVAVAVQKSTVLDCV